MLPSCAVRCRDCRRRGGRRRTHPGGADLLPEGATLNGVKAAFENGVLEVSVPLAVRSEAKSCRRDRRVRQAGEDCGVRAPREGRRLLGQDRCLPEGAVRPCWTGVPSCRRPVVPLRAKRREEVFRESLIHRARDTAARRSIERLRGGPPQARAGRGRRPATGFRRRCIRCRPSSWHRPSRAPFVSARRIARATS